MMSISFSADPVPLRRDANGDIRVGDSRVLLDLVIRAFDDGATSEAIVQRYPTLKLSDVYATIAYCLNHRADVDAYLRERADRAAAIQATVESTQPDMQEIRKRLLNRTT